MLLRNGTVLNQYPLRQLGGGVAADITMFNRNERRNIYSGITDLKSGIPNGHVAPSSWLLPLKPGGMSSINYAILAWTATATGAMGAPVIADTTMTFHVDGAGSLITSGDGSATMAISIANAQLIASLSGTGGTTFAMSGSGTASGEGAMVGASTCTFSQSASILPTNDASPLRTAAAAMSFGGTLTSYAIGSMAGSTLNGGVLSEASIIAAMNDNPPAVNIQKVNGITITGTGQPGAEWGP